MDSVSWNRGLVPDVNDERFLVIPGFPSKGEIDLLLVFETEAATRDAKVCTTPYRTQQSIIFQTCTFDFEVVEGSSSRPFLHCQAHTHLIICGSLVSASARKRARRKALNPGYLDSSVLVPYSDDEDQLPEDQSVVNRSRYESTRSPHDNSPSMKVPQAPMAIDDNSNQLRPAHPSRSNAINDLQADLAR